MGTYQGVANDPDINQFTQSDLQDLTESGVGEGMRGFVVWIPLIVLILVLTFLVVKAKGGLRKAGGR